MWSFSIKYSYDDETNQYIAFIPELNLSDFWDTIFEAEKNLTEQLKLYIEELKSNNTKTINNNKEIYT